MNKCDIKIMAVPSRMANVVKLCSQLGLGANDVFVDYEMRRNALWTSRQTFSLPFEDGITHRCVLQDDSIVAEGFVPFIEYLVNRYPHSLFTLLCTSKKLLDEPYGTIKRSGGMWGVGVIIPRKCLDIIYSELDNCPNPNYVHDDRWYANVAKKYGWDVLTSIPNAVRTMTIKDGNFSAMGHPSTINTPVFCADDLMSIKWQDDTKHTLGLPVGDMGFKI